MSGFGLITTYKCAVWVSSSSSLRVSVQQIVQVAHLLRFPTVKAVAVKLGWDPQGGLKGVWVLRV